jgi:hypothetical protein
MRNGYSYRFVKKTGALILMLFMAFQLNAQVDISIGNGTTGNPDNTNPCPFRIGLKVAGRNTSIWLQNCQQQVWARVPFSQLNLTCSA